MERLAQFSPQAGHYYEILTSLSDAIGIYQRKLSDDRKRMASQYMDQIFTEPSRPVEQPGSSESMDSAANIPQSGLDSCNMIDGLGNGNVADVQTMLDPYGTTISEGFPWPADDFQFDWSTYAPFLDDVF